MNIYARPIQQGSNGMRRVEVLGGLLGVLVIVALYADGTALGQSTAGASSVRSFGGGVSPLFKFGGGSLYIDNQGTQGFLYTPAPNFQSYNFRNPTTGQAWSGAVMTFGPQLSIGLIQGANQIGSPTVLPGPPRETAPLPPIESGIIDEIP
ncbi:MAG: hypothetical protein A4E19_01440 [Nitrospira sp. SG-bin1]|nr:MAG: hypothetical protein A4E19_01440 [Nitrospira sp. SG-bin1]